MLRSWHGNPAVRTSHEVRSLPWSSNTSGAIGTPGNRSARTLLASWSISQKATGSHQGSKANAKPPTPAKRSICLSLPPSDSDIPTSLPRYLVPGSALILSSSHVTPSIVALPLSLPVSPGRFRPTITVLLHRPGDPFVPGAVLSLSHPAPPS